ncbi:uncharacterized protein LOC111359140 [Spodoptera litura]|uniref:Uncharacterized protein LOC111359140 n=1 Tax=Spodoptera litura TaxID=69820 RepID=A0A9J7J0V5_SPOLT|nr:uncharacterized protein LOC111359140 [Spodoptera litura]
MEINQDNDGDTMVDDTGALEHMDIADEIEIKDVIKIRKKKPNVLDDENKLKEFEDSCNVDVHKLSSEEKLQDVLDRKSTPNYQNSPHRCELCFKGFLAANLLTNHFLMHHDPSIPQIHNKRQTT